MGEKFEKDIALFTSSIDFDKSLFEYDIHNTTAHVVMLTRRGIIKGEDGKAMLASLLRIEKEGLTSLPMDPSYEDIHMAIEAAVLEMMGEKGGGIHSGRSRNDQVATDLRMKARDEVNLLCKSVVALVLSLLEKAEEHTLTIMPSYTHLQQAQPTTLAHHLTAYAQSLLRSIDRLEEAYKRVNLSPLGSGAATTTSFPIDRSLTADLLGFEGVLQNSMDAVSNRDYMCEVAFIASLGAIDASRIAEELIIWSTAEYGFVEIADSYASTSSIMPQKKNPDVLEIIRARTAAVLGGSQTIQMMLRSLPQSYNRDLQEVSPVFFRTLDTTSTILTILSRIISSLRINEEKMLKEAAHNFSTATELADLLVKKEGIPFRTAHNIVGSLVQKALKEGISPADVDKSLLNSLFSPIIGRDLSITQEEITKALTPLLAVETRIVPGGPSPSVMEPFINNLFDETALKEENLNKRERSLLEAKKRLYREVKEIIG